MSKIVGLAAAAAVLGGTLLATPSAEARPGYGYGYGYGPQYAYRGRGYRRGGAGPAIAAGVAGALIGGALATQVAPRYGYYDGPYGRPAPAYGYGYAPAQGYGYAPYPY